MINTAEQHQISGLGFITTPDAFIPWRGVKVSGIVLFLKLMTLSFNEGIGISDRTLYRGNQPKKLCGSRRFP